MTGTFCCRPGSVIAEYDTYFRSNVSEVIDDSADLDAQASIRNHMKTNLTQAFAAEGVDIDPGSLAISYEVTGEWVDLCVTLSARGPHL